MTSRRYGRHIVEIGNPDKEMFPGITKQQVIEYYEEVSERLLPHLRERPLTLRRFPDGIENEGFYQKRVAGYYPDWIDTVNVESAGEPLEQAICSNSATLAYLANQAVLEFHPWQSRAENLHNPDLAIFDLDPFSGQDFAVVRAAAGQTKALLDELDLRGYLKTTGSRGLHVVVPLRAELDFDTLKGLVGLIAETLVARHPESLTTAVRKASRGGRLFVDTLRNAYAQTAVAPYSLRARPGAPVALPIAWDALETLESPDAARIGNLDSWLNHLDPWSGMQRRRQSLASRRDRIQELHDEARENRGE